MRILLIAYLQWSTYDLVMRIPNLSLASISAHADKKICNIKVVDLLMAGSNSSKQLGKLLREYKPDLVGFSVATSQYFQAIKLAKIVKEFDKNIKVVMGGYHPTLDYEEILKNDKEEFVDFIIRGEAELSFNEFVKALNNKKSLDKIPGLSYRQNGMIVNNPPGDLMDIDEIKLPDRDARIITKGYHYFGYPADIIEMSRGCPFGCSFCCSPIMYGKNYRKFRIERILEDIKDVQRRGAKAVLLADHNVTGDPYWYNEVCKGIIDSKLNNMKFGVQASVKGIKQAPGLAENMVKSGVEWVLLGIENVSPDNMEFANKSQFKNTDTFEVVSELKAHGAIVMGSFILGFPEDTEECAIANYEYAKELGVDVASFSTLTPYPNTPVREALANQGLITNFDDYSKYDLAYANIKTKYLSEKQVFDLAQECSQRYLFDTGSIWRIVKRYPAYMTKLIFQELMRRPRGALGNLKGLSNRPISIKKSKSAFI